MEFHLYCSEFRLQAVFGFYANPRKAELQKSAANRLKAELRTIQVELQTIESEPQTIGGGREGL